MKPKAFAALAVITIVMFIAALAAYVSNTRVAEVRTSGAPLIPGLAATADRIAKITISQGAHTLTLARDKEGWSLEDRGGYRAKADVVRTLLLHLASAELVEAKTRSKERYPVLEVEDPQAADAKSHLVRLLDGGGKALAEVIVGKRRSEAFGSGRGGTYVRKPGEDQSWLVNAEISTPSGVRDWVEPGIIDIPAAKIATLSIVVPGEEPLKIVRDASDSSKHALAVLPEGKKLKDSYTVGAIVRAAGAIDLDDVRRAASPPAQNDGVVELEADGGLKVTLKLHKIGEDYWLTAEAHGSEAEANKTAEEIMRRAQGWEFKLPSGKAQSLLKRRADLFEGS